MSSENATSQVIVCCNVLWKHWYGAAARAATSTVGWTREALGSHVAAAASRHQSRDRCIDLSVNVRDKQLRGEGATWLADELRVTLVAPAASWSLASLDLSSQAIGVTGARELSQYLFTSPTLTTLTLNACELGDQGIRELCAALDGLVRNRLEFSSRLASLSAVDNALTDDGAVFLADSLSLHCKRLVSLQLGWNSISDRGVEAIAFGMLLGHAPECNGGSRHDAGFSDGPALALLNLDGNCVSDIGARALALVLERNCSLTRLSLSGNARITAAGALALYSGICANDASRMAAVELRSNAAICEDMRAMLARMLHLPADERAPWGRRKTWLALNARVNAFPPQPPRSPVHFASNAAVRADAVAVDFPGTPDARDHAAVHNRPCDALAVCCRQNSSSGSGVGEPGQLHSFAAVCAPRTVATLLDEAPADVLAAVLLYV
jgi:hypothetical protein